MFELTLTAMTCNHCVAAVTKAINEADPHATVEIDLPTHRLRVQTNAERARIIAVLTEAGYAPAGA